MQICKIFLYRYFSSKRRSLVCTKFLKTKVEEMFKRFSQILVLNKLLRWNPRLTNITSFQLLHIILSPDLVKLFSLKETSVYSFFWSSSPYNHSFIGFALKTPSSLVVRLVCRSSSYYAMSTASSASPTTWKQLSPIFILIYWLISEFIHN